MVSPALCVIEAKTDNFDEGWTQALLFGKSKVGQAVE
jgi:hypothetical protein